VENIRRSLVRGLLEYIVLDHIAESGGCHGYELIAYIRGRHGVLLSASEVYPLLNRLEREGYLVATWILNGGKPRKVYKLTSNGKLLLKSILNELTSLIKPKVEVEVA
jgi:DNA-binding PadR family transcriptional regulator